MSDVTTRIMQFLLLIMLCTVFGTSDPPLQPAPYRGWSGSGTPDPALSTSSSTQYTALSGSPGTPSSGSFNTLPLSPQIDSSSPCNLITPLSNCQSAQDLIRFVESSPRWSMSIDVSTVYQDTLRKCASLELFRILDKLINSMMDQNIKRAIPQMDINVWNTFFVVYFERNDVLLGTKFFIYLNKMYGTGSNQRPTTQIFNTILRGIATNDKFKQLDIADVIVMDTDDSKSIMQSHGAKPDEQTYSLLMQIYAKNGRQCNIWKATDLLIKAKQEFKFPKSHSLVTHYTQCLNGSSITDYNDIIEYLYHSLRSSNLESASIAEWLYRKCMELYSMQRNAGTYLSMMKVYAGINAKSASIQLWRDYESRGFAEKYDDRRYTFNILLEYFGIHSRQRTSEVFKIRGLLLKYRFNTMSDWEAVQAVLAMVKSVNEYNESLSETYADVLFVSQSSVLDETRMYLIHKISETGSMDWWFDPNIPNKEIYQWIMTMFHQVPHHDPKDATLILTNALNANLFPNVVNDSIISDYAKCFDDADVDTFNEVLQQLDKYALNGQPSCSVVAEYVFMNIMPHYGVAPNDQSYILLMKLCTQFHPQRVAEFEKQAFRERNPNLTISLFLLRLQHYSRNTSRAWNDAQANLGFDFLLRQPAVYHRMVHLGQLNHGFAIVKKLIETSLDGIHLSKDVTAPRWSRYLMKVVQLIHELAMYDKISLRFWMKWLTEKEKVFTRDASIHQLGMELAFVSLQDHARVENCISIIKNNHIFKEFYGLKLNSSVMSHGFRLDLTQFNVKKDRLQMWWALKYVVYKIVIPSDDILVIVGTNAVYEFICDEIFKGSVRHYMGLETSMNHMVIPFNDLLNLKLQRSHVNHWNSLEVSGSEYSLHMGNI